MNQNYINAATRKKIREGKTDKELLELFYNNYYRTERAGKLEDGCFVDIMICDHCNLNCSGCDHFSPLAEKEFIDIDTFKEQLIALKRVLPQLNILSLWGGEAILHPQIKKICKISREIFPNIDIIFGSNGVLLGQLSDENLKAISENNIGFQISRYLADGKLIYGDLSKLDEYNIHYSFSEYRNFFEIPTINPEGTEDPKQWYTCSRCTTPMLTYRNFKLYKCAFGACSKTAINIGIEVPEVEDIDYLDLRKEKNTKETIFDFVFKPSNKCKYCKENYINHGFCHQINKNKDCYYLFDMKDFFLYNQKEYRQLYFNEKNMDFMREHIGEDMAWDTDFNPMLDVHIKNRYFFGTEDIIVEINNSDISIVKTLKDNFATSQNCFYIILNNLSIKEQKEMFEEVYGCINFDFNVVLIKKDFNETLKDVYNFIINNSHSPKIKFLNTNNNLIPIEIERKEIKNIIFDNASENIIFSKDKKYDLNIESIYFNFKHIETLEDFLLFINKIDFNTELELGFKALLIAKSKWVENIPKESIFLKLCGKNSFVRIDDHTTYSLVCLEYKILSMLNESNDIRIKNIIERYQND